MTQLQTGIDLKTGFFPLAWFLYFCSPVIEIDGEPTKLSWGSRFVPAAPGTHEVEVYYNYLFGPASRATITVEVPEQGAVQLVYSAPILVFMAGNLRQMKRLN